MGKKAAKSKKSAAHVCGGCKNFDPDKKGGFCRHHEKKRSKSDKACGSYQAR